jgi:hypothetical protein
MNEVGRFGGQLLTLGFLVVVAVAIVLLIAGYGLPVGLGALVGLILGLGASALTWSQFMRASRQSVSGSWAWFTPGQQIRPDGSLSADFERFLRSQAEIGMADRGRVVNVVPVMQAVETADARVEIVSLERREAGFVLALEVLVPNRSAPSLPFARVMVDDDIGTEYGAASDQMGSTPNVVRYSILGVPAIPDAATRLSVTIEAFIDPFPSSGPGLIGPWHFEVPLR